MQVDTTGWVNLNTGARELNGNNWTELWAVVCHCLWNWRNNELHIGGFSRPLNAQQYIVENG